MKDAFQRFDDAEEELGSIQDQVTSVVDNLRNIAEVLTQDISRILRPEPNLVQGSEMFMELRIAERTAINPEKLPSFKQLQRLAKRLERAKKNRDAAWNALPQRMQQRISYSGPVSARS